MEKAVKTSKTAEYGQKPQSRKKIFVQTSFSHSTSKLVIKLYATNLRVVKTKRRLMIAPLSYRSY